MTIKPRDFSLNEIIIYHYDYYSSETKSYIKKKKAVIKDTFTDDITNYEQSCSKEIK